MLALVAVAIFARCFMILLVRPLLFHLSARFSSRNLKHDGGNYESFWPVLLVMRPWPQIGEAKGPKGRDNQKCQRANRRR